MGASHISRSGARRGEPVRTAGTVAVHDPPRTANAGAPARAARGRQSRDRAHCPGRRSGTDRQRVVARTRPVHRRQRLRRRRALPRPGAPRRCELGGGRGRAAPPAAELPAGRARDRACLPRSGGRRQARRNAKRSRSTRREGRDGRLCQNAAPGDGPRPRHAARRGAQARPGYQRPRGLRQERRDG
jgi:hypothetical protein